MSVTIEDSTTYQLILNKGFTNGITEGIIKGVTQGRAEEARAILLRLGAKRFGPASAADEAAIRSIADGRWLDRITDRLLDATGWDDLLSTS